MKINVILDLKVNNKDELINYLASYATEVGVYQNSNELYNDLKKREEAITTGIGDGICLPHHYSDNVSDNLVVFFKLKNEIDFKSLDNQPVTIGFLLLSKDNQIHLTNLSKIANFLLEHENVKFLKNNNKELIIEKLLEELT